MFEPRAFASDELGALADSLARDGFVQVRNPFPEVVAQQLHACLSNEVPWGFAWFDQQARYLRAREMAVQPEEQTQALLMQIMERAGTSYQYAYDSYPILDAYLGQWNEVPLLHRFLESLNSEPMLNLVRSVARADDIVKADAQATRFRSGQFLGTHDDISPPGEVWRVAYVYNLTPRWRAEWGGHLLFYDDRGNIRRGLMPEFNVLNLLRVPQRHAVAPVAGWAGAHRCAITGWFRSQ